MGDMFIKNVAAKEVDALSGCSLCLFFFTLLYAALPPPEGTVAPENAASASAAILGSTGEAVQ